MQYLYNYWTKIQQYKGSPYYQQLLNNPYLREGGERAPGVLEGILNGDGFWSKMLSALSLGLTQEVGDNIYQSANKSYLDSHNQEADAEFDRIMGLMQENAYNSPSAQVGRETAAGINPALVGVSGTPAAGNSGPNETAGPIMGPDLDAQFTQSLGSIGSMFTNYVSGFMNMISFFQDYESKSISNAAGDISLLDSVYSTSLKTAAGLSGLPASFDEYNKLTEEEKLGADQAVYDTLTAALKEGSLGSMVLNRRAKSMLKKMTGRVMYDKEGKPTLAFQQQRAAMLKSFYGDTLEAGKAGGHPVMSDPENIATVLEKSVQFFGDYESKMMDFNKKMMDINRRYQEALTKSAEAQSTYDQGMYDNELGQKESAARKAMADAQKVQNDMDSYLDKQMDTLMDSLDQYGIGGKIAKIGLVSLRAALKSFTMSLNPLSNKAGQMTGMAPGFGIK